MNYHALFKSSFYFQLFLLRKLPLAFIVGLKLLTINEREAFVTLPFRWLNTNPFRSMYFACLAMAAELSTGVLVMYHISKAPTPVSMLVTGMQGEFTKRGLELIRFECTSGELVLSAIHRAIETKEGQRFTLESKGYNTQNECICHFQFEWSVKAK